MGNYSDPNIEANENLNNYEGFLSIFDSFGLDNDSNSDQNIGCFKYTGETTKSSENKLFVISKSEIGRKRKKNNENGRKTHSKYDKDNIIRKIQVHFLNFLVSFINEILLNLGIGKKFLNINYKNKKKVKKQYVELLKSQEIGQILRQNISTKYRRQYIIDNEKNNKVYLEVIKNDNIRKILSETYINIFRNYYYKNKREINDYGLNIKLSNNVKTYQDFLELYKEDNGNIERINNVVKKCYLPKKLFIQNKINLS